MPGDDIPPPTGVPIYIKAVLFRFILVLEIFWWWWGGVADVFCFFVIFQPCFSPDARCACVVCTFFLLGFVSSQLLFLGRISASVVFDRAFSHVRGSYFHIITLCFLGICFDEP